MRATKVFTPIYIALLFAALSCNKDNDQLVTVQDNIVTFTANVSGTNDGADKGSTPTTKGTLLNNTDADSPLSSSITEFKVAAFGTERFIPAASSNNNYETVSYSDNKWSTANTYYWPDGGNKTFYAYANISGTPNISCTTQSQVLSNYSISTDYTTQLDILMGFYSGTGSRTQPSERTADIKFYHPLTAVRFTKGTTTGVTITKIKSIAIKGIHSSGTVTQTGTTFTWSGLGTATNNITMSPQGTETELTVDGTSKLISNGDGDDTFILIPQDLATNNVTIEITADTEEYGTNKTYTGTLSAGAWQPGNIYVYQVNWSYAEISFSSSVENWNKTSDPVEVTAVRGAMLMNGSDCNTKYRALAPNDYRDITKIVFENKITNSAEDALKAKVQSNQAAILSSEKSVEAIYAEYDDGTITISTPAEVIYTSNETGEGPNYLFYFLTKLTDIDNIGILDMSKSKNFKFMFRYCYKLSSNTLNTKILPNIDVSSATDLSYMFADCTGLTTKINVEDLNTSNVTDMQYLFYGCSNLEKFDFTAADSKFTTANVTSMISMFSSCSKLEEIKFGPNFNTENVENMSGMFSMCDSLKTIDLSSFNTSKVENMETMFSGCKSLTSITFGYHFQPAYASYMTGMFMNCSELEEVDLEAFGNPCTVNRMGGMFYGCSSLKEIDLSNFCTSYSDVGGSQGAVDFCIQVSEEGNVMKRHGLFENCTSLTKITFPDTFTTKQSIYSDPKMDRMFYGCTSLTSLDLSNFNTQYVVDMDAMFYGCTNLGTITFGSNFKTANVTDMGGMFYNCGLTSINLSNFNTGKVSVFTKDDTDKRCGMFEGCTKLTSITFPTSFSTSSSGSPRMDRMFLGCTGLTSLDLSSFDTQHVVDMDAMFYGCTKLATITFGSNFKTGNVTTMRFMFGNSKLRGTNGSMYYCTLNFDTSNVEQMGGMFYNCTNLTSLDITNFNTSNVKQFSYYGKLPNSSSTDNYYGMFQDCTYLSTITCGEGFVIPQAIREAPTTYKNYCYMFKNTNKNLYNGIGTIKVKKATYDWLVGTSYVQFDTTKLNLSEI